MPALPVRVCEIFGVALFAAALVPGHSVAATGRDAQSAGQPDPQTAAERPRGCATPVSERQMEAGCYTTSEAQLGVLPAGPLYWHIYAYASRAAADAARGPRGTTVQVFNRHWLYTIAEEQWRPTAGEKIAIIGPLLVASDRPYTARYLEAVFPPGLDTGRVGHRHPGPEAWYVVNGSQCLETPNGLVIANAGGSAMVPEGWPMAISAFGPETRRALVLILHPSAEPYSMAVDDPRRPGAPHSHWTPKGLCPK